MDLDRRTFIMGVINCTPDSFYAGSRCPGPDSAIELGVKMVAEGADLLDIGGESSRPGAEPVSEREELRRVIPVIEGLMKAVDVPLSIDTYKAGVAEAALELGAHIINDITALRGDDRMAAIVAQFDAPVVLMHMKGAPQNMQVNPSYDDVLSEVTLFLQQRIDYAVENGIPFQNIVIDPGIGFGKRIKDNYHLLQYLDKFANINRPILVGPSRKSFIGKTLGLCPEESLTGTIAAAAAAILNGAHILRMHDVKEGKNTAHITDLIKGKKQLK